MSLQHYMSLAYIEMYFLNQILYASSNLGPHFKTRLGPGHQNLRTAAARTPGHYECIVVA